MCNCSSLALKSGSGSCAFLVVCCCPQLDTFVAGAGLAVGVAGAGFVTGVAGAGLGVGVVGAGFVTGVVGAGFVTGVAGAGLGVGVAGAAGAGVAEFEADTLFFLAAACSGVIHFVPPVF